MKPSRTAPRGATTRARALSQVEGRAAERPTSVEEPVPGEPPPPPGSPPSLIFGTPDGPDTWLVSTRAALLDLLAAAREGARRPRKRVLARAEIRRQAREAFAGASALLDEAAEALRAAAPRMR